MILLIDNYDSFTYNLYQNLLQCGKEVKVVRNDKITLAEIKQLKPTAIVLSPGPGRPETAGICIALIKALAANDFNEAIPLLGVCLGHQAIAVAFGGSVVNAGEIYHGKSDLIFHERKYLYQTMPLPFQAGRYHSLIVDKNTLPVTLTITAENANQLIMGIKHINLPIYGVQFHPESILTPQGLHLLQQFVRLCKDKNEQAA